MKLPPVARRWLKAIITLPYRFRFDSIGSDVKIMPPLMLHNPGQVRLGNRVIVEQLVGFSVDGGSIHVGDDCELRCFSRLEAHCGEIRLGARTSINPFTLLSGYGGLLIGSDVRIGSHCQILSSSHKFDDLVRTIREQGVEPAATVIEDDVWLGSGCTVTAGVAIGRGSVIGAGSVVTKDVPPMSIAAGVPARVLRSRSPS